MRHRFYTFAQLAASGLLLSACQTSGQIVPGGALIIPTCQNNQAYLDITVGGTGSKILQRAPHLDAMCLPAPNLAASAPKV